jgi:hypothetical protein
MEERCQFHDPITLTHVKSLRYPIQSWARSYEEQTFLPSVANET